MSLLKCGKRAFDTYEQARARLRTWQRNSRKTSFDSASPYLCERCRKYHVGHTVAHKAAVEKSRAPLGRSRQQSDDMLDDLEQLFTTREESIRRKLGASAKRLKRARPSLSTDYHDEALLLPETGTLCLGGDEFNVYRK